MPRFEEEKQKEKLALLKRKEEEETTKFLAGKYQIPYLNLQLVPIDPEALRLVPEQEAREAMLVVFGARGKSIDVAVAKPAQEATERLLANLKEKGFQPKLFFVSLTNLGKAWSWYGDVRPEEKRVAGQIEINPARVAFFGERTQNIETLQKNLHNIPHGEISEVLELLLAGALTLDASDIHFEPEKVFVRMRYRFDGVLQEFTRLTHQNYKFILSRLKLISGLKLNIRDKAQDGRFTIATKGEEVEVRTSTIPGPYGEGVVLRVLNPKAIELSFEHLGMRPDLMKLVERELQKPTGMILTTGPTGSGKTTTLYGFIKKVLTPDVKIITIEDPIEYHLPGISQTQVDAKRGYTFVSALRSILRHDPDIILVGEIRDLETAGTALHAALTGHLVFSTLHTNDAIGTIPRLIDMGAKPPIIAPAVNMAMAQRLVRKVCGVCKKVQPITTQEKKELKDIIKKLPKKPGNQDILKRLESIQLPKANGCPECNNTGYKGRIGLFEAFLIDDVIERLILANPTEADIKAAARQQGMITMFEDGILKVIGGITTLEEVRRVMGIEEEQRVV